MAKAGWRRRKKTNQISVARGLAIDRLTALLRDPTTTPEQVLSATRQLERLLYRVERTLPKPEAPRQTKADLDELRRKLEERGL
jgi:hypothetical protein